MISSVGIVLRESSSGGTERTVARLARAWSNVGVDVTFYHGQPDEPMRALMGGDSRIVSLHPRHGRRPDPGAADLLAAQPVHAILVPDTAQWPFARMLARLPAERRPVIVAQTGTGLCRHRRPPVKRLLHDVRMRRFLGEIDGLVAPSEIAAARAGRILGGGPVVRTIATPLPDDTRDPHDDDLAPHRFGDAALAYLDFFGTLRSHRSR